MNHLLKTVSLPFDAAIFDLDGTLLDSLSVWRRVDEAFFARRGLVVPEGYSAAIAGMSYPETAEYTVRTHLPGEDPDALIAEWMLLAKEEYAKRVPLKQGALSYLRLLRRSGVRMAVATAMPQALFEPCLERLGISEWFDVRLSTDHVDGAGKASGAIFREAARRLDVPCERCAVFEDVPAGILGAKRAGMRAYAVLDPLEADSHASLAELADGAISGFDEMRAFHPFDDRPRCVIFTARCDGDPRRAYVPAPTDYVLCADAGWQIARTMGVLPDLIVGDFDSSPRPSLENVEVHPVMKDDSDTMLCLRRGLRMGYDRFLLVGGFGGRPDHTWANVQALRFAVNRGCEARMDDGVSLAIVLKDGEITLPPRSGKLSVLALSDRCRGVSIEGALYTLRDAPLQSDDPLGLSNAFLEGDVRIRVREGALLILCTDA